MQILVVGAGVVGLAIARAAALAGHEVIVAETCRCHRHRDVVAQQRGHPRRALLSDRLHARAITASARGGCSTSIAPRTACRIANAASSSSPPTTHEVGRIEAVLKQAQTQRGRGRRPDRRRGGQAARAGACLPRRHALAGDRHHRQSRLHARAARRSRRPWRRHRLQHADRAAGRRRAAAGRCISAAPSRAKSMSTRWSTRPGSARSGSAAPPKAIRRSGCRASCSPRAIISASRGGRCFRG